jgi:acetyl/propionyl-CoA carboxylase alpha subunit
MKRTLPGTSSWMRSAKARSASNGAGAELARRFWPRFRADSERVLSLETPARHVETDVAADHHGDVWASLRQ